MKSAAARFVLLAFGSSFRILRLILSRSFNHLFSDWNCWTELNEHLRFKTSEKDEKNIGIYFNNCINLNFGLKLFIINIVQIVQQTANSFEWTKNCVKFNNSVSFAYFFMKSDIAQNLNDSIDQCWYLYYSWILWS